MIKILLTVGIFFGLTTAARAEPISAIIALVSSFASAVTAGVTALGTAVFGATAWGTISAFLASPFGSLLLGVGLSLVSTLFMPKQKKAQSAPTTEAGKVNARITEPERWMCAGYVRQGGGVLFGEFDSGGNFWFLVVHSDSILAELDIMYFDDMIVYKDSLGVIQSPEFCLDDEYNTYSGSGTKVPYFQIMTTTYSETNPTPPAITNLRLAFPQFWTVDHKLVGTTYSVIRVLNLPIEHRYKIYKWRGSFGLGEPAVSLVGMWSNIYDPRDETQDINNRTTWKPTRNPVLIWAWFRTHRFGRAKSMDSINWIKIAEQADICDQVVSGINDTFQPRYECGISIPESKERSTAEQEILLSCDGQIVFDDDGRTWIKVGYYEPATLNLTRNRDIVGMESVEAQSGESETQGVIVRYLNPEARFSVQPSAAWLNPIYYNPAEVPKFLQIDVLTCQNHNQAMRLAKAIGMRSQSAHKILPTVGLRGLKARQERIVNIQYDNTFAGEYEIVTPVEVDELGVFCGFGAVPVDEDRWRLLPGEEKPKPVIDETFSVYILELPTGVINTYRNGRLEANFDPPPRKDWRYRFQYRASPDDWSDMVVQSDKGFAYSGAIAANEDYEIRWQTVSGSGRVSAWSSTVPINTSPLILTGTPVGDATTSAPYAGFTIGVTGGVGPYTFADINGKLPPGITVNSSGHVGGTASTVGNFTDIVIKVSDAVGNFKNFPTFAIVVT